MLRCAQSSSRMPPSHVGTTACLIVLGWVLVRWSFRPRGTTRPNSGAAVCRPWQCPSTVWAHASVISTGGVPERRLPRDVVRRVVGDGSCPLGAALCRSDMGAPTIACPDGPHACCASANIFSMSFIVTHGTLVDAPFLTFAACAAFAVSPCKLVGAVASLQCSQLLSSIA